jgi:WD40 repeat protein
MSVRVWDVETGQAVGKPMHSSIGLDPGVVSTVKGVSRDLGGFVDLGSLNARAEEGVFKYSIEDRVNDVLRNHERKEQKEKARRKGFAVEPVEASTSKSILPEFGSYTSGQVLADVMGGKSMLDALRSHQSQPSSPCTQSGMLRGHEKEVLGIAISQDGLRCASCSVDGTVRMWDLTTGTQVATCEGHKDWVWGVAITADGRLVASCGKDHSARVWNFEGELLQVIQHKGEVLGVALTSNHKLLVTGQGKSVFVWQVGDGSKVVELKKHTDLVRGVSVTENGHRIASGSKDKTVIIWDTKNASALFILHGHSAVVRSVHITAAGVISCSSDKTVRLWNVASGKCVATLHGHSDDVRDVCMNANASVAVSCSFDQTVRVWDLQRGKELAVLTGHTDKIFGVALNGEGSVAVSCSWDMSIRIWDIDIGQQLNSIELNSSAISAFLLGPGSSFVKLDAPATPRRVLAQDARQIQAHDKEILDVAITADGCEAVTCSVDGTIRLWDLDTGEQIAKFEGHSDWAWSIAMTPDGTRVASCGRDRTVIVWDMVLRRTLKKLVHVGEVLCVAILDDGMTVVTGQGKDVLVWNVKLAAQTAALSGHTQPVRCVAAYNGRVVSGSQDATLRVWGLNGEEWSCKYVLKGHTQTVRGVCVQSNVILSGSQDQTVHAWKLEDGEMIASMRGHSGDVRSVGLSANGMRAVSGSFDRTVRIWDVMSGEELSQLQGHTDKIFGVAICADGTRAVSCSWDTSLRVWDLREEPADHQVLHPPSATGDAEGRLAPDSILSGKSIVGAVKAALNRSNGYDEIQTDSSSNESGRSTPEGPASGGGVGPDSGRRKRIWVDVAEEENVPTLDGKQDASGMGRLGEAMARFLGRKDDIDLDEDEREWERSVLAEQRHRREVDPERAHEMSRLTGEDLDFDNEDEDEEKIRVKKDKARQRSSFALALGFICFFPWCAGLVLDGGLKSQDKITRNINRVSVLLLFLCIVAASGIVTARYTVKDNMFCGQCDNLCARVCADCGTCKNASHWWCHQPRSGDQKGFCSSTDLTRDFLTTVAGAEVYIPDYACSRSCGCNGCLGADRNWCRYPKAKSVSSSASSALNGTTSLSAKPENSGVGAMRQELLRREVDEPTPRRVQWSFDGDDGYCDEVFANTKPKRLPSRDPDLCDCKPTADGDPCQQSCCCDSDGCHPTKCTT